MALWALRLIGAALLFALLALGAFRTNLLTITWPLVAIAFASLLAAGAFIVAVAALMTKTGRAPPQRNQAIWSVVLAAAFLFLPLASLRQAIIVPPIHDISTRPANPPVFVDVLAERRANDNSLAYMAETMDMQLTAYPDIMPLVLPGAQGALYDMALDVAQAYGWRIVSADAAQGRIEAVARSAVFGFRDDVLIVLTPVRDGVQVDMRSASRVGRSDLGVNARRIRAYLADLEAAAM